jgi:hypothetical protein
MTIPGTLLVLLLAISFPTGVCCEGGLLSTLSANEWHNLPGGEKQAYVAGLIHGFDATKYFLYLSGRVAITEDTSKLSPVLCKIEFPRIAERNSPLLQG